LIGPQARATPNLTLSIYARQMDRRDGEPGRLKELAEGREWTALDSRSPKDAAERATATLENGANGQ
jgi:hypothetical protein